MNLFIQKAMFPSERVCVRFKTCCDVPRDRKLRPSSLVAVIKKYYVQLVLSILHLFFIPLNLTLNIRKTTGFLVVRHV